MQKDIINIDYIIVGQGIAGSVLAHTLLQNKKSILMIDNENLSQSSRVAAGLYNPVVFKRLVKSWLADELIPYMDNFYQDLEVTLKTSFYYKKEIVKLFADKSEKDFWLKKSQEDVSNYLDKKIDETLLNETVYTPYGVSKVLKAGNLDTSTFLSTSKKYFEKQCYFLNESFEFDNLSLNENKVCYNSFIATKIIFCEGYKAAENPYFSALPFKLTKGEVLTIKTKSPIMDEHFVLNKGVFILPLGNNTYKVGATYQWNELNELPTDKGKLELLEKVKKLIKLPFEVILHQAGIRPTVSDRRPLIGLHHKYNSIGIFNGMGTKAVMIAPFFAVHFFKFLEQGEILNKEVDINRFNISN